ncbi:hypothetical protein MF672_010940 [Actinomadura sp. ATCC 31491]|uniref:Uncharacterized protein n=1 Tax=Actinomadura luzonensis TaxID=2805427 RepID=A0ABT0FQW0_9ACTN|nr:hypothetical protein [Actinomadura luzonensis]MCK2214303.1 hypothetical protein [Actinomadura luzonensis]
MREQPDERPSLDDAARQAEQSRRRAEADLARARERARASRGIADRLRRMREDNHFARMFDEALGGGRHG